MSAEDNALQVLRHTVDRTRRLFLGNVATAMGGIGLLDLLMHSSSATAADSVVWQPGAGQTHHAPKAKRVLQIMCPGAASHMDLWEHKPALEQMHGQPLPGEEGLVSFQGKNGNLMKSPWEFVPCGESGKRISSMMTHMARHVDDMAFCHAMHSKRTPTGRGASS